MEFEAKKSRKSENEESRVHGNTGTQHALHMHVPPSPGRGWARAQIGQVLFPFVGQLAQERRRARHRADEPVPGNPESICGDVEQFGADELVLQTRRDTLRDFIADRQPRPITVDMILEATSEQFSFDLAELIGKSRRRPLVEARQIAMYVTRELTDLSFPNIAKVFGGRDHTTVIHAVERIKVQMKERRQVFQQVTELIQQLKADG